MLHLFNVAKTIVLRSLSSVTHLEWEDLCTSAQKTTLFCFRKCFMSPGISESSIILMWDPFPLVFKFEIYYLTLARPPLFTLPPLLQGKMEWPVKLSIHHTHLLLKPLQESNHSSRSSHTSCQSSTWQLPEAPQFFRHSWFLHLLKTPSPVCTFEFFSFSFSSGA